MRVKVLVFPCGSEIGLEIHRSLKYSTHIELVGGSSVDDHGRFVYNNYIGGIPDVEQTDFVDRLNEIVVSNNIDAIYPAHDSVVLCLAVNSGRLMCKVIGSEKRTSEMCRSKLETYQFFKGLIEVPKLYLSAEEVTQYPVFLKPAVGQGSKGTYKAQTHAEISVLKSRNPNLLILEYLPGEEFTIDCFTDKHRSLRFAGARQRVRTTNGISVNTKPHPLTEEFKQFAQLINTSLIFRGAWFFQAKRNQEGRLSLLEIAPRIAGSMALYRCTGVNFPLLSVFDAFDMEVEIQHRSDVLELDRALGNKYSLQTHFEHVYVDLDDCLIINDKLNTELIQFLYQCVNEKVKIHLVSRHKKDIHETLATFRITALFDQVHHLAQATPKSSVIQEKQAIFIDDSFSERKEVAQSLGIPVYAPDAVEALLK